MSIEKLKRSRQRLLDLTLRNRLLNFRPGHPNYRDDVKAHKHIVLKGHVESVWRQLVQEEKHIEILVLTRAQQAQVSQEIRIRHGGQFSLSDGSSQSHTAIGGDLWEDIRGSVRGISQLLQKGDLISLLPEEAFLKRLTKIRNEQNTLANSTGDSALFLAIGFLEWSEPEPHPRAGEPLFAPLILVHVNLSQNKKEEGGEREFRLHMDVDQPQGNPCLAEKLRQDFSVDLPEFSEDESAEQYWNRVRHALRSNKQWSVNPNIALGFFNFARYRLWLDLNPDEWPDGHSPIDHPVIGAILNGDPLPQEEGVPTEEEVANHQETEDLPVVLDSDSTQYAALLAAKRGVSIVVQGPPGSGKSQTITNLIAVAMKEGKRVLFVAQKLPALQVVQRRLESVELAPFCLPLFSDKARVSEMHAHFIDNMRIRESASWTRGLSSSVIAAASKLNEHATRMRERPVGYSESVCSLIQRATALSLLLRESWGAQWNDNLFEITVPDSEPGPEWIEHREQTLHQWHLLNAEVGDVWSNWTPLKLGPMDTKKLEAVIRRQQQAALSLNNELRLLPEDFHELTITATNQLCSQIKTSRLTVLTDVLQSLLSFLWQAPDNAAAVARLEHELEEFNRHSEMAEKHLHLTAHNRSYIAARATEALNAVRAVVSPRSTVSDAKSSLNEFNEALTVAEDLITYAKVNPDGISVLQCLDIRSQEMDGIAWKHVEALSSHRLSAELKVPIGAKLLLANYVLDNSDRQIEAHDFQIRLSRYHTSVARLKHRIFDPTRLQNSKPTIDLDESLRLLCEYSLGRVQLKSLPVLEQRLSNLISSLHDLSNKTPKHLSVAIFGHTTFTTSDIRHLSRLADLPSELFCTPANGTEKVMSRLAGISNPETSLTELKTSVESYQTIFQELRGWFPEIQPGLPLEISFLDSQKKADRTIHELGLNGQTLESLAQLTGRIETFRLSIGTALDSFGTLFKPWPNVPPESLRDIHLAKALFLHLINRPQAPEELNVEALCSQGNIDIIATAMRECQELRNLRENYSNRVAFRDLPDVATLSFYQRELRPMEGKWWRWFSSRYRKVRTAIQAFVISPLPSDKTALKLLFELEVHERRRVAFQDSPVKPLLGALFRGIETSWPAIKSTVSWIRDLRTMTQSSDITPFVHTSLRSSDSLREGVRSVEILTQLVEQNHKEFSAISSFVTFSADPWAPNIQDFAIAVLRTESSLKELIERIKGQINLQPLVTFSQLSNQIGQLDTLQTHSLALRRHSTLVDPLEAVNIHTQALDESIAWLTNLTDRNISRKVIDALIGKTLNRDNHLQLILSAAACLEQIVALNQEVAIDEASWLSEELRLEDLGPTLLALVNASALTHRNAVEWAFQDDLTIFDVRESVGDVHEIESATAAFIVWRGIFKEEPSLLSDNQLATTLDWLKTLREHGASADFLRWLLAEETDVRIQWWQELVSRGKDLKSRFSNLQDRFTLPLIETQSSTTLASWSALTADRNAKLMSALDVIESHSQSIQFTVHDLALASAALHRTLELETILEEWTERLGLNPTTLEVERIQSHRQWTAAARSHSTTLGNWLVDSETSNRCEIVMGLRSKLTLLMNAIGETQTHLNSFGSIQDDGPFSILSTNGTPRDIQQRCNTFIENLFLLPPYAALLREIDTANRLGINNLIKHADNSSVSTSMLIETFRGAVAYQQAKSIWEADNELRYFQSDMHERLRKKFQGDDEKQLRTNRKFIQSCLADVIPREGQRGRTAGEHTQFSLLRHEMEKQRRHLPIRKLVQRAGQAMQDLCPCWMMTPLAVAQFLPPGAISFDLVVMDEASQINPEDAWGAIARGTQLVIVGDQKQMPPSDFFTSALEEDESPDEEDDIDGGKSESILDASVASLLTSSLLWHYRSRHETLIAPANSFSYGNRLILFPHPHRSDSELGIRYHYIANAVTTLGKVINALEAAAIARRVRVLVLSEYAKPPAIRKSIGVVTMNLPQQDCVMDLLETMQRSDRRFDLAMSALATGQIEEPFFVRNLENIQGDERDIMIISCTYGPNAPNGTPTQRFGPLTREGGERRFNVLITRAKWRMEVFASIRSEQIIADGKRQGVRDFHLFLKYAESGVLADQGEPTEKQNDSPFEIQVEAVLRREGFDVERQIGVAGYFIDLAVKHPIQSGLFAIGIECDGATYHSSRTARDRDRLREQVLMERGWKLHRIWSTDWFVNPKQAKTKLIDAVSRACR